MNYKIYSTAVRESVNRREQALQQQGFTASDALVTAIRELQREKAMVVKASLLNCKTSSLRRKYIVMFKEGDITMKELRNTQKAKEIGRNVGNLGRDLFYRKEAGSKWIEKGASTSTSEGLEPVTPKGVQHELKAIKERYNQHPRRPHEWLSSKGEEGLRALKAEDPKSVEKFTNPVIISRETLGTYIKKLSQNPQKEVEVESIHKQLEAARTLQAELQKISSVDPRENLRNRLSDTGKEALDKVDPDIRHAIESPVDNRLKSLRKKIDKLKGARDLTKSKLEDAQDILKPWEWGYMPDYKKELQIKDDEIRKQESLAKVPRLVEERIDNERQREAIQDEQAKLRKLMKEKIPDEQMLVTEEQLSSTGYWLSLSQARSPLKCFVTEPPRSISHCT